MAGVGERIKKRRVELGWTQDQLCQKAGRPTEVALPSSLAKFAAEEGLSLRETLMLLDMQKQIVAHRSARKKDGLQGVDWQKFYEGVKEFLESE